VAIRLAEQVDLVGEVKSSGTPYGSEKFYLGWSHIGRVRVRRARSGEPAFGTHGGVADGHDLGDAIYSRQLAVLEKLDERAV
jgi:hypothetical protein